MIVLPPQIGSMERLIVLPPVRDRVRKALLNLVDYKDIPTEQLKQTARKLPGGGRVHLPDRVTTIAFVLLPAGRGALMLLLRISARPSSSSHHLVVVVKDGRCARKVSKMIRCVICGCSRLDTKGVGCAICGGAPGLRTEQVHITEETKAKLLAHARELKAFGVGVEECQLLRKSIDGITAFGIALAVADSLNSGVLRKLVVYLRDLAIPEEQIIRLRLDEPEKILGVPRKYARRPTKRDPSKHPSYKTIWDATSEVEEIDTHRVVKSFQVDDEDGRKAVKQASADAMHWIHEQERLEAELAVLEKLADRARIDFGGAPTTKDRDAAKQWLDALTQKVSDQKDRIKVRLEDR
jgi:hypothetical protein